MIKASRIISVIDAVFVNGDKIIYSRYLFLPSNLLFTAVNLQYICMFVETLLMIL